MRLAVLQAAARPQESGPDAVLANLALLDDAARRAAAAGADLLVTPELFPTGYAPGSVFPDARIVPALCATAASHRVAVVASEPWDGRITAVVVSSSGDVLGRYAKTHLFGPDERAAFVPGTGAPLVVDISGVRVGVGICYDVEFPEFVRALALAGAELVCVPTANDDATVGRLLVPARGYENEVAVAYANHVGGSYNGGTFCGESVVAGPDGRVLARGERSAPALLLAGVTRKDVLSARAEVDHLRDRRPETYQMLLQPVDHTTTEGVRT